MTEMLSSEEIKKAIQEQEKTRQEAIEKSEKRRQIDFSKLRTPEAIAEIDAKATEYRNKMVRRVDTSSVNSKPLNIDSVLESMKLCIEEFSKDPVAMKSYGSLVSISSTDFERANIQDKNSQGPIICGVIYQGIDNSRSGLDSDNRSNIDEAISFILLDLKRRMYKNLDLNRPSDRPSDSMPMPIEPVGNKDAGSEVDNNLFMVNFDAIPEMISQYSISHVSILINSDSFVKAFKKAIWKKRFQSIGRLFGLKRKKVVDEAGIM